MSLKLLGEVERQTRPRTALTRNRQPRNWNFPHLELPWLQYPRPVLVNTITMAAILNGLFGGSKPSVSPVPAGDTGMF